MTSALKTGTTTLAMVFKDGVVLAAERRALMGTLIAHKVTKKVFKVDDHLGLTTAGLVGDAQLLTRYLTAEAELYRLKRNKEMSVGAAATLMANIMAGRKLFPYWVQLLIAGVDDEGPHVFSLDPAGGSIPDKYVTTGSGSVYVYGVLEDHYRDNMSLDDAVDLAIRALTMALKRDAASGEGIDLVTITSKKFTFLEDSEISKRKKKMKLE
jgi:proteasome beta subunit